MEKGVDQIVYDIERTVVLAERQSLHMILFRSLGTADAFEMDGAGVRCVLSAHLSSCV
jgi:hypothetical protein